MGESSDLDSGETRVLQHSLGDLFSPHCSQSFPTLGQGYGHAMHAGDRVHEGSGGVIDVVVNAARCSNVLHEKDPPGLEGTSDALQNSRRLRLIVDGIERCDQVVLTIELCSVLDLELDIVETVVLRF